MKKRWAFVAWPSLVCLIGLTWLGKNIGFSAWQFMGVHMAGMVVASATAFFAMRKDIRAKWPAIVALIGSAPMLYQDLRILELLSYVIKEWGVSAFLWIAGSFAASIAAFAIAILPLPPPPTEPRVAPARVVDE